MRTRFDSLVAAIEPVDQGLAPAAQAHLDNLTKPQGSLGRLEELALRLTLVAGGGKPAADPARIYTVAGDHGVAAEGVSLFPQEVTRQMVLNFVNGGAGINVLARANGIDLKVVDAGCLGGGFDPHPNLVQRKVASGTANLAQGPAMTEDQCLAALLLGADLAGEAAAQGFRSLGTGDMGIANTTPSTALYCAYLGLDPLDVAGPGTGLAPEAVRRKAGIISRGMAANAEAVASGDPLRILAALGGLEIATLAGLILGAARSRMAVAVDGFISTAAYVAAWKLAPAVADYAFFSHASAEPGHAKIMAAIGGRPLLHLDMRLGEGTGAALALTVMRSACAIYNEMASFAAAGVSTAAE
ncbi:MAG: nicotinate-nucleotide--dimethylbenzimidazole phosphoribosyltransferase [Thermodesulfobacteriota bacterium]